MHTGSPAKFPTKPTEERKKIRKMYAIKQIEICAEYRDMLPRPRLVCQEPGLRPIGRSPGVPDKSSILNLYYLTNPVFLIRYS